MKLFFDRKAAKVRGKAASPALFDLSNDVGEIQDVSQQHPDKVKELQELARKLLAEIEADKISLGRID